MSNRIMSSFIWKYMERCGTQVIQFAVSIILARLLAPHDFGLLALVTVFIAIANVFVQSGLTTALVQKKDATAQDFSTVFWLSTTLAAILYIALFFTAPLIARFYENESLIPVVRVLGLTLFLGVISSIQGVYVQKNFLFKKLFFRSLIVAIPSGGLCITLAYLDFGVWALVWQQLTNAALMCGFMFFMIPWKPTLEFSIGSAKKLFNFGYKILLSSLLDTGDRNITGMLIGKVFSPEMLGFYNRGQGFPNLIVTNINDSISAVMFPALADVQDNISHFKHRARTCIKCSCFLLFPLMSLLASAAAPTVSFLLGDKWLPCVVFLQANCFIFALWPLHTTNLTAINSLGRSDIFLKLEIMKCIMGLAILAVALFVFRTPIALVIGYAITAPLGAFINSFPNKKLLHYGFGEQIKDVIPIFILATLCGLAVFPVTLLKIPSYAMIAIQVPAGLGLYMLLAKMFKMESYNYMFQILNQMRKDKIGNEQKNIRNESATPAP